MSILVVIPARYGSSRLPGKPLRLLAGKPLIEHVYRRACEAGGERIIIATDDARIAQACEGFGAEVCMTSSEHASGTDRVAEVIDRLELEARSIVVNLQGDEPLIPPVLLRQVAELLQTHPQSHIATLSVPLQQAADFHDPHIVKVVSSRSGSALYFSRSPIPHQRDGAHQGSGVVAPAGAARHIGLYAYRAASLRELAATPPCPLECSERLEQLRALWLGMRIQVTTAAVLPGPGVDTEEDLLRVEALLTAQAQHDEQAAADAG